MKDFLFIWRTCAPFENVAHSIFHLNFPIFSPLNHNGDNKLQTLHSNRGHDQRGRPNGRQRYDCKACHYHFVIGALSSEKGFSPETQALAVFFYGTMKASYSMIAQLLNTTRKTVYFWIKRVGE